MIGCDFWASRILFQNGRHSQRVWGAAGPCAPRTVFCNSKCNFSFSAIFKKLEVRRTASILYWFFAGRSATGPPQEELTWETFFRGVHERSVLQKTIRNEKIKPYANTKPVRKWLRSTAGNCEFHIMNSIILTKAMPK